MNRIPTSLTQMSEEQYAALGHKRFYALLDQAASQDPQWRTIQERLDQEVSLMMVPDYLTFVRICQETLKEQGMLSSGAESWNSQAYASFASADSYYSTYRVSSVPDSVAADSQIYDPSLPPVTEKGISIQSLLLGASQIFQDPDLVFQLEDYLMQADLILENEASGDGYISVDEWSEIQDSPITEKLFGNDLVAQQARDLIRAQIQARFEALGQEVGLSPAEEQAVVHARSSIPIQFQPSAFDLSPEFREMTLQLAPLYLELAKIEPDSEKAFELLIAVMAWGMELNKKDWINSAARVTEQRLVDDNEVDKRLTLLGMEAMHNLDEERAMALLKSAAPSNPIAKAMLGQLEQEDRRRNQTITAVVCQQVIDNYLMQVEEYAASWSGDIERAASDVAPGERAAWERPRLEAFFEAWYSLAATGEFGGYESIFATIEKQGGLAAEGLEIFKKLTDNNFSNTHLDYMHGRAVQEFLESESITDPILRGHQIIESSHRYLLTNGNQQQAAAAIGGYFSNVPELAKEGDQLIRHAESDPTFDMVTNVFCPENPLYLIGEVGLIRGAFVASKMARLKTIGDIANKSWRVRAAAAGLELGVESGVFTMGNSMIASLVSDPRRIWNIPALGKQFMANVVTFGVMKGVSSLARPLQRGMGNTRTFGDPTGRKVVDMATGGSLPALNPAGIATLSLARNFLLANGMALGGMTVQELSLCCQADDPSYLQRLMIAEIVIIKLHVAGKGINAAIGERWDPARYVQGKEIEARVKTVSDMLATKGITPGMPDYDAALRTLMAEHLSGRLTLEELRERLDKLPSPFSAKRGAPAAIAQDREIVGTATVTIDGVASEVEILASNSPKPKGEFEHPVDAREPLPSFQSPARIPVQTPSANNTKHYGDGTAREDALLATGTDGRLIPVQTTGGDGNPANDGASVIPFAPMMAAGDPPKKSGDGPIPVLPPVVANSQDPNVPDPNLPGTSDAVEIDSASFNRESFAALAAPNLTAVPDRTSVAVFVIEVDDVTQISRFVMQDVFVKELKPKGVGYVEVTIHDKKTGLRFTDEFTLDRSVTCPEKPESLKIPPTIEGGQRVVSEIFGEETPQILAAVSSWDPATQERFFLEVEPLYAENSIPTLGGGSRLGNTDTKYLINFKDPKKTITKLVGMVNSWLQSLHEPIGRFPPTPDNPHGEPRPFRRFNATQREAYELNTSFKPDPRRMTPAHFEYTNVRGKVQKYEMAPWVMDKLDAWILEKSIGVQTEVKGFFTTETLPDGTIRITDFIPEPCYSQSLAFQPAEKRTAEIWGEDTTMQTLFLSGSIPIMRILGIEPDDPRYALLQRTSDETHGYIAVHSHFTATPYQDTPSPGDFYGGKNDVHAVRTPYGGLIFYDGRGDPNHSDRKPDNSKMVVSQPLEMKPKLSATAENLPGTSEDPQLASRPVMMATAPELQAELRALIVAEFSGVSTRNSPYMQTDEHWRTIGVDANTGHLITEGNPGTGQIIEVKILVAAAENRIILDSTLKAELEAALPQMEGPLRDIAANILSLDNSPIIPGSEGSTTRARLLEDGRVENEIISTPPELTIANKGKFLGLARSTTSATIMISRTDWTTGMADASIVRLYFAPDGSITGGDMQMVNTARGTVYHGGIGGRPNYVDVVVMGRDTLVAYHDLSHLSPRQVAAFTSLYNDPEIAQARHLEETKYPYLAQMAMGTGIGPLANSLKQVFEMTLYHYIDSGRSTTMVLEIPLYRTPDGLKTYVPSYSNAYDKAITDCPLVGRVRMTFNPTEQNRLRKRPPIMEYEWVGETSLSPADVQAVNDFLAWSQNKIFGRASTDPVDGIPALEIYPLFGDKALAIVSGSGELVIGRDPSSDFVINSPYVSHRQAVIRRKDDHWVIVNEGKNPIFINGQAIPKGASGQLALGDKLKIGDMPFEIDERQIEKGPGTSPVISPSNLFAEGERLIAEWQANSTPENRTAAMRALAQAHDLFEAAGDAKNAARAKELLDKHFSLQGGAPDNPTKPAAAAETTVRNIQSLFAEGGVTDAALIIREREIASQYPTVAIDLDGTLAHWSSDDKPFILRPGVEEGLRHLFEAGLRIVLWTGGDRGHAQAFFEENPQLLKYFSFLITRENFGVLGEENWHLDKNINQLGYRYLIDNYMINVGVGDGELIQLETFASDVDKVKSEAEFLAAVDKVIEGIAGKTPIPVAGGEPAKISTVEYVTIDHNSPEALRHEFPAGTKVYVYDEKGQLFIVEVKGWAPDLNHPGRGKAQTNIPGELLNPNLPMYRNPGPVRYSMWDPDQLRTWQDQVKQDIASGTIIPPQPPPSKALLAEEFPEGKILYVEHYGRRVKAEVRHINSDGTVYMWIVQDDPTATIDQGDFKPEDLRRWNPPDPTEFDDQ